MQNYLSFDKQRKEKGGFLPYIYARKWEILIKVYCPHGNGDMREINLTCNHISKTDMAINRKKRLTKRALDRWDSAAFSGTFLALSLYFSQALSTPAHLPVTQTVGRQSSMHWKIVCCLICFHLWRNIDNDFH